jgi:glycosyltransferase involved in cell wall biosynthesis
MKITILTYQWLLTKGGPTTFSLNLSKFLKSEHNAEIKIITADKYRDEEVLNIRKNRVLLFWDTITALFKTKPEVIHCNSHEYMLLAAVVYKVLQLNKPKIVFAFHTAPVDRAYLEGMPVPRRKRGIFKRKTFEWALNHSDLITSVSHNLAERVKLVDKLKIKRQMRVVIPGVSVKAVDESHISEAKKEYAINGAYPILCTIGVFEWESKVAGIKILLETTKELKSIYPNIKLLIAGDGRYRKYLENIVEGLGINDNVLFMGYVNNPFIPLSISDIYCHIPLDEALGISVLEAMLVGRPVIASNRGGLKEIIQHEENGLLIEPGAVDATKAIIRLLDDKKLQDILASNASQTVKSKYTWRVVAAEYYGLYSELLAE